MTRYSLLLVLLSSSLLAFAACGGGDDAATGDDVAIDAGPDVDAEIAPDADTSCTTDTPCLGHIAGDVVCSGSAVVTCNQDGDCLSAASAPCVGGDQCVDDGTPACETPVGESCATAQAITADTTISGTDFAADYTNDQDFTDASCDDADPDAANAEAVFSVALVTGQRITVTNSGGIDTVMTVQTTCSDTDACVVADDDPDTISYVAAADTTVYVSVGAYEGTPDPADYDLAFDVSSCGDGVVDTDFDEECDDGHVADDDGCSATCTLEPGYECTDASPTVCTAYPDLGSFGVGGTINYTGTALAQGASQFMTVTFTAPVLLTGNVTATAGDPNLYGYTPSYLLYNDEDAGLVEQVGNAFVPYYTPGTYTLEVWASTALTAGYTMALSTAAPTHTDLGTFAPTDAISDVVDADGLAAAESSYFTITFSAPVLLSGTLNATTTGDIDLYWWTDGDLPFVSLAGGNETITDEPLPAGTYHFVVNAYEGDPAVDAYTLTLSTTAAP